MNIAIVFAGGVGKRMKTKTLPKQFLPLFGDPIIIHTLRRFEENPLIDKIIIVMLKKYIPLTQELVKKNNFTKVVCIVPGGNSGQESIFNGLEATKKKFGLNNTVLLHDGVRPYFENDLIERCIASVNKYGSAISCVPATETTTQISKNDTIETTINRSTCYLARAPQCFNLKEIYAWHKQAQAEKNTSMIDSCSMMLQYCDRKPHLVLTVPENIKVTTPLDFYLMRAIIEAQDQLTAPEMGL